jgi:hypothetical protein
MSTPSTRRVREVGQGLLPEPAPRVGAHTYAGKRVRDDAREAILVMVFSITSALGLAGVVALLVRLAG